MDKTREDWRLDGIAPAFDGVTGLGDFVEFEFKGEAESIEQATAAITEFIDGLGIELGEKINAGYPHLALGIHPSV